MYTTMSTSFWRYMQILLNIPLYFKMQSDDIYEAVIQFSTLRTK
jgi:hypothetical protein